MGKIKRITGFMKACFIGGIAVLAVTGAEKVQAATNNAITVKNTAIGGTASDVFEYDLLLQYVGTGADDIMYGTKFGDGLYGRSGNDTLYGGAGNDTLDGGTGNETLYGQEGNDSLNGGAGDDIINGGPGNDELTGGGGSNTYVFSVNDGDDVIRSLSTSILGIDRISISGASLDQVKFAKDGDSLVIYFTNGTGKITVYGGISDEGITSGIIIIGGTSYTISSIAPQTLDYMQATDRNGAGTQGTNNPFTLTGGSSVTFDEIRSGANYTVTQKTKNEWTLTSITGNAAGATINTSVSDRYARSTMVSAGHDLEFTNRKNTYTVTFDVNGHGTAPAVQTIDYGEKATEPPAPTETGWTFKGWYTESECINEFDFNTGITNDIILYAKWTQDQPQVVVINPISKRLLQNNTGVTPDMTFTFSFTQQSEWDGVSYVSASTPIADKSVTITDTSNRLTSDAYVGDLTDKKLLEGKVDNVLTDFAPTAAGTYCYLVKENIPNPQLSDVTYTASEFVMLVEVEDTGGVLKPKTVTNILYKDSSGKTKADYMTPPSIFDEKQELIFYNNYGTTGGTTPTGIITNIMPFIVIGGAGVGGLALYAVLNAKRRKKDIS